jgi:hypothetical protein
MVDSYELALEAVPMRDSDTLFVEPNAGWRLLEETALAAWYLGMTEFAENAFKLILQCPILPPDARVRTQENLTCFDNKKLLVGDYEGVLQTN